MREARESTGVQVSGMLGRERIRSRRSFAGGLLFLAVAVLVGSQPAAAQSQQWTWQGGADIAQQPGVYGPAGDPGNIPGARDGASSWRDASGNLWLFGGLGYGALGTLGNLNDLWKWDGTSWTWMSGSDLVDEVGSYGPPGDPTNTPGAREGAVSWTDNLGNLWLFGGYGYALDPFFPGALNDLWKWDGTSWTWVSGSTLTDESGIYAGPGAVPGARSFAVAGMDSSGNLLLFGGLGYGATPLAEGGLNDLWSWDGTSWTWLSGSDEVNQYGSYGIKNTADPSNVPGARAYMGSWTDSSGRLWVFGGNGLAESDAGYLNDLWRWDGTNWTWVSGSSSANAPAIYGTMGVAAPGNVPGGRASPAAFLDAAGSLWLFGGDGELAGTPGYLSDLWRWDGTNWTWVRGANTLDQPGNYGALGVPAASNDPGARYAAASWSSGTGNTLTMFGGYGVDSVGAFFEDLNDFWTFQVPSCSPPSASITAPSAYCSGTAGNPASVPDAGAGATYAWTVTGGTFSGAGTPSIVVTPTAVATTVTLSVVVTIPGGCAAASGDTIVPVTTTPAAPTATSNSPVEVGSTITLFATVVPGATYSWTGPNGFVSAAQNPTRASATLADAGTYSVTATVGACTSPAGTTTVVVNALGTLTVTKLGSGTGLVTSSPAGINCGGTCSAPFSSAAPVVLTATAEAGSHFTGWTGGGCSGTGTCSVTVSGATAVSATFVLDSASLYYPLTPCRLLDTRLANGPLGGPVLAANETRTFDATTPAPTCGIPSTAKSISVNYTVESAQQPGELRAFAGNGVWTGTSVHSFKAGVTRANNGQLMLATDGTGTFQVTNASTGTVDLIVDVSGYWQ